MADKIDYRKLEDFTKKVRTFKGNIFYDIYPINQWMEKIEEVNPAAEPVKTKYISSKVLQTLTCKIRDGSQDVYLEQTQLLSEDDIHTVEEQKAQTEAIETVKLDLIKKLQEACPGSEIREGRLTHIA